MLATNVGTPTNTVPAPYGTTGDYGDPSAFFSRPANSPGRPRAHFCWLHGWNNSHGSPSCRVMSNNAQYTILMRTATSPDGNGGNPNVGPPVRLPFRLPDFPPLTCLSCPSPTQDFKAGPNHPNDETVSAGLATFAHRFGGAKSPSRTSSDEPHVPALSLPVAFPSPPPAPLTPERDALPSPVSLTRYLVVLFLCPLCTP